MRLSTILLTALVVAGGFGVLSLISAFAVEQPAAEVQEQEVVVAVQPASIQAHRPYLAVIGTIEAKVEVTLSSPLETDVLETFADEGDLVDRGTQLARIDTRETNFQLETQLANRDDIDAQIESLNRDTITERRRLAQIRKLAALARDELERNENLLARGVVAQAAVDQAQAALSGRELEILGQRQKLDALDLSARRLAASRRGAEAQIGQLRLTLERASLKAPFAGVVNDMRVSPGSRISRGAAVVDLYDPSSIRLRVAIPNEYAGIPDLQSRVISGGREHIVSMLSISPKAKPGRGTVDAYFALPEGSWLLGTAIGFDLLLPARSGLVAVPFDALYSGSRIYVVDGDSRAQAVDCTNAGQTVVDDQLQSLISCPALNGEDRIVVNRIPNLVSGTKLRIVDSAQS